MDKGGIHSIQKDVFPFIYFIGCVDASKFGALHRQSSLGRSPQISLEGVSQSSSDTKKNRDFQ